MCLRGDTDFSLTGHFDRWAERGGFGRGWDAGHGGGGRGSGVQADRSETSGRRGRNRPVAERNNRFKALQSLFRDTMAEIHKVSWPDQQTTRNLTLIVIGTAVVLGE